MRNVGFEAELFRHDIDMRNYGADVEFWFRRFRLLKKKRSNSAKIQGEITKKNKYLSYQRGQFKRRDVGGCDKFRVGAWAGASNPWNEAVHRHGIVIGGRRKTIRRSR